MGAKEIRNMSCWKTVGMKQTSKAVGRSCLDDREVWRAEKALSGAYNNFKASSKLSFSS